MALLDSRSRAVVGDFVRGILRMVVPFSIAIGLAYYFLIVAQREDPTGYIRVLSEPTGAAIFIDGASTQYHTDTLVSTVKKGNHKVMLDPTVWKTEPSYYSIEVSPKDTVTVKFVAQPVAVQPKPTQSDADSFRPEMSQIIPTPRTITTPASRSGKTNESAKRLGAIQVSTNRSGAEIFLNGTSTGKFTTSTLEQLTPGTYEVTVRKEGFQSLPDKARVTVDPDVGLAAAYFELISQTSEIDQQSVSIVTTPSGQTVSIDGKRYGPTPVSMQLPLGRYRVEFLAASGYETPAPKDFTVTKREAAVIQIAYQRISGDAFLAIVVPRNAEPLDLGKLRIEINGRPFFNGSNMETASALWKRFPEGEKTVTIVYDNLTTDITTDFQSGQVTPIELRFERLFSQIKPRLRVLERQPYEQYRTRAGKLTVFD